MSSDTYRVRVLSVDGPTVRLEVRPTPAVSADSVVLTRSFVLGVLAEVAGLPIASQTTDEGWVREHVGEYVVRTEVESLVGLSPGQDASAYELTFDQTATRVTLRAELASAALAARFREGDEVGTACWDVWWGDPLRPARPKVTSPGPLFSPDAGFAARVASLVVPLVPGARAAGKGKVEVAGEAASLIIEVALQRMSFIGTRAWPLVTVRCPAVDALVAGEAKKKAAVEVFTGVLLLPAARCHAGVDPAVIAQEIADQLARDRAALDATLTLRGLVDALERRLEASPDSKLKSRFVCGARGPAPTFAALSLSLPDDPYFLRAVLMEAAGDHDAARAAVELTAGRWKKRPPALSAALARIESA